MSFGQGEVNELRNNNHTNAVAGKCSQRGLCGNDFIKKKSQMILATGSGEMLSVSER